MEHTEQEQTLSSPGVIDKFQAAGKIAQQVLGELIEKCQPGADIHELCTFGNKRINEECAKVYFNKKMDKGVAFPVSIAPNDICGHFAPIKEESFALNAGDLVKIDLGVHIDGFPVSLAHTIVVGSTSDELKLKTATAAYHALVSAVKQLVPGKTNADATKIISDACGLFNVQPLEGVLSHEIKRYILDGNTVIINKETVDQKVDTHEFKVNDVFAVDVIVSGNETEGKSKESELRTTIFKRNIDANYDLKTKNGRQFLSEVKNRFADFCFSLNDFEDALVS